VPPFAASRRPGLSHRPGERPLAVPEHLRFEQAFGQRGAVDRHERPARTPAVVVDELRDHLLAATALPRDEDRGIRRRDLAGQLDGPAKGRRRAEQGDLVGVHVAPLQLRLLIARLACDEQGVDGAPDKHLEVRGRERLRQVVEGPLAQRFDAGIDRRVARHHDDDGVAIRRERRAQQGQPADLRQIQVGQDDIEGPALQQVERLLTPAAHRYVVAFLPQHTGAALAQGVLVVHDQYPDACLEVGADWQKRRKVRRLVRLP